jgi:hypothetical protein
MPKTAQKAKVTPASVEKRGKEIAIRDVNGAGGTDSLFTEPDGDITNQFP